MSDSLTKNIELLYQNLRQEKVNYSGSYDSCVLNGINIFGEVEGLQDSLVEKFYEIERSSFDGNFIAGIVIAKLCQLAFFYNMAFDNDDPDYLEKIKVEAKEINRLLNTGILKNYQKLNEAVNASYQAAFSNNDVDLEIFSKSLLSVYEQYIA